jgi:hypothetical protein
MKKDLKVLARRAVAAGLAVSSLVAAGCTGGGAGGGNVNNGVDGGPLPPATGVAVTREVDPQFPNRTIWRPSSIAPGAKLPVILWGVGGCTAPSSIYENGRREVASHNYFVISSGLPDKEFKTTPEMMRESIDIAVRENAKPGGKYENRLDTTKIGASGQSCGGIEALTIGDDPRLSTVFVWNSGLFGTGQKTDIAELHTPTLWFTGGSTDIAYSGAQSDYSQSKVPSVWANYGSIGHSGSDFSPRGGLFAQVELLWVDWHLKGKTENKSYFVGAGCKLCTTRPWSIQSKTWG